MKNLKALLYLFILSGFASGAYASHNMGGFLRYDCVNSCTTRVHFYHLTDCGSGIALLIPPGVQFKGATTGCTLPTAIGSWTGTGIQTEITPLCPGTQSDCQQPGSPIYGIIYQHIWQDYDVCSLNCTDYFISWETCCQSPSLTSHVNGGSTTIYTQTLFKTSVGCNNAPVYDLDGLVPYLCDGMSHSMNLGALDPDGDSLAYSLMECFADSGVTMTYNPGFSLNSIFGSNWIVNFDTQTGELRLDPNPGSLESVAWCVETREYRAGNLIGVYNQHYRATVVNCSNSGNNPLFQPIANLSSTANAQNINGTEIYLCAGTPVCFDIPVTDADTNDLISLMWNSDELTTAGSPLTSATFLNLNNTAQADSFAGINPTAQFCWANPVAGNYAFTVIAIDPDCPIEGRVQRNYVLHVGYPYVSIEATQNPPGCGSVNLNAFVCGGQMPYTYLWSGPNLSGVTIANPAVTGLAPGTYTYTVTITDFNGAVYIDTSAVSVQPADSSLLSPTDTAWICAGSNAILDAGAGWTSYSWSTGAINQAIMVTTPGTYGVTVSDGNCYFKDEVVVTNNPQPSYPLITPLGPDTLNACTGVTAVQLHGQSGFLTYAWSQGATTQDIFVNIPMWYYLTVTDVNGCSFVDSIDVSENLDRDITGTVLTSTGQPLANQKVYLVWHDTANQALYATDTAWTDGSGYFEFCEVTDTIFYLKAAPDSMSYPTEMPTYYNSVLFWNQADSLNIAGVPYTANWNTLFGANPGGSGFIGGLISQGANKTAGIGDPLPGIAVYLLRDSDDAIMGQAITDATGYFRFDNLGQEAYRVAVDVPGVDEVNTPVLTLSSVTPGMDSLDFRLHSSYLELVLGNSRPDPGAGIGFDLAPNPIEGRAQIHLDLPQAADLRLTVTDLQGRTVAVLHEGLLPGGSHKMEWNPPAAGMYFLRLEGEGFSRTLKAVVH